MHVFLVHDCLRFIISDLSEIVGIFLQILQRSFHGVSLPSLNVFVASVRF
jgi:hypothetical protein